MREESGTTRQKTMSEEKKRERVDEKKKWRACVMWLDEQSHYSFSLGLRITTIKTFDI